MIMRLSKPIEHSCIWIGSDLSRIAECNAALIGLGENHARRHGSKIIGTETHVKDKHGKNHKLYMSPHITIEEN